ncbi:MAG: M6 family metalloprotease domain-containing protein [Endomicrobiaceae bacterium]|jgi:M6 family metalloprotease-like protein|nr:M6 family metalloprotease domain-containing protein [Endomicrobiaceae bacterium]
MKKIRNIWFYLFLMFVLIYSSEISFAVIANPKAVEVSQPDGSKIKICLKGDEFYSWNEDSSGYTILKDNKSKYWVYAQKDTDGSLKPSAKIVGKNFPVSIQKSLKDETKLQKARQKKSAYKTKSQQQTYSSVTSNYSKAPYITEQLTKTNLVILVQFNDVKFTSSIPFKNSSDSEIISAYNNLFNQNGYSLDGAKGSVFDFFKEASYAKINMNSVITQIITLDNDYEYYYQNGMEHIQDMVTEALTKLNNSGFNFKAIWPTTDTPDNLTIIHAGGGAEYAGNDGIWSHMGFIPDTVIDGITFSRYHTAPARRGYDLLPDTHGITIIGVICHESMHFFGVPDLYDYTYTSAGVGPFCLMAGGSWNTWQGPSGNMPAHPSAWIKYILGWINPKTPVTGVNNIAASGTSPEGFYILKSPNFSSYEYFLVENRQALGFDYALPEYSAKRGLLIYHIDESRFDFNDPMNPQKNNNDRTHYLVALEQASAGTWDWTQYALANDASYQGLSSDYFRTDTVSAFNDTNTSSPDSRSYYLDSLGERINSGIQLSGISNSANNMYFIFGQYLPDYEAFVDALSDAGLSFVNKIMGYSQNTTRILLKEKLASESEKTRLSKYFSPTVQGADDAGTMGTIYSEYQSGSVCGIPNGSMGIVSATNARLIVKLNYAIEETSQAYKTVGNITDKNNDPLIPDTSVSGVSNKRFTGTTAIADVNNALQNYGYLMPNFTKMKANQSYNIEPVYETTDVTSRKDFTYFPGKQSVIFTDLAHVIYYPNPVRNSKLSIINLPSDQQNLSIQFFTVSGQLIRMFSIEDTVLMGSGSRMFEWDCKNKSGSEVAQGVYFMMIRTDSDKLIKKIAVIR